MGIKAKVVCLFLSVLVGGCNSHTITGDYIFIMTNNSTIRYISRDGVPRIRVIETRVEQYFLSDNLLFVSRTPVDYDRSRDRLVAREGVCEYWLVDVKSHAIRGPFDLATSRALPAWRELSQHEQELKSRETLCPLL